MAGGREIWLVAGKITIFMKLWQSSRTRRQMGYGLRQENIACGREICQVEGKYSMLTGSWRSGSKSKSKNITAQQNKMKYLENNTSAVKGNMSNKI